jgi:hypothetical protein
MNLKEHLKQRHLNLELHRPVLDYEHNVCTLYCWNLTGQMVGYQQYAPLGDKKVFNNRFEGKYYTYRKLPTVVVWGTESLYQSDGVVYLTEGIFDAARMTNVGQSALAAMSNNPPADYKNWLSLLNRPVVAVCDNDDAGRKLAKFGHYVEVVPDGKDLGDAPDDYVRYLLSKYAT